MDNNIIHVRVQCSRKFTVNHLVWLLPVWPTAVRTGTREEIASLFTGKNVNTNAGSSVGIGTAGRHDVTRCIGARSLSPHRRIGQPGLEAQSTRNNINGAQCGVAQWFLVMYTPNSPY